MTTPRAMERQAGRFLSVSACGKSSPSSIDSAMASAKTWLIAQANIDGGFAERNPQNGNLETSAAVTTAMAIRALSLFAAENDPAAITAIAGARSWLNGQQKANGSWHDDPFVTARVVAALPAAAAAQLVDSDLDGLTDVVEQQLGTQLLVADAQEQLDPNGHAVPGLTVTAFTLSANLNEAFSYTVSAAEGAGPFAFALVNGALPPGLAMAANGQIAGSPSALGSYAFDYEVTDAEFRDAPKDVYKTQEVGIIKRDFGDSVKNAENFANVTNQNQIPYWPLGPNSNSYASTFVESLIGTRPSPIVTAPGADMGRPSPRLNYTPSPLINSGGATGARQQAADATPLTPVSNGAQNMLSFSDLVAPWEWGTFGGGATGSYSGAAPARAK